MSSPIRFAILAGVSTDTQARDEKQSIPDQVENCRKRIEAFGGIETAGPYIMDGYSRSGYDSLDVAMQEIPPLGEAIAAATANQYDVLIMDNFDRLGDLGVIVKTRFKKLRKQLHSARQSGKIAPPDEYDPYASEEQDIAMYVEGIIQSYRINKLRRGWNVGVPERANTGLHPLSMPYGYRVSAPGQPAVQNPEQCALVIQMKDWYLEGKTLQEICDRANESGVKPRRSNRWQRTIVKGIVLNPYYAGITVFGKQKARLIQPPSAWVRGKGRHVPLWDEETYRAILAEADRRAGLRQREKVHALTGILECAVCRQTLHRHGRLNAWVYLYCDHRHGRPHVSIRYEKAVELIAGAIVQGMQTYKLEPASAEVLEKYTRQIREQQALRTRVQEGFEAGLYTPTEAHKRIVAIETEIDRLHRARDRAQDQQHRRTAMLQYAREDLSRMQHWIINDDPRTVNVFLSTLCEKILISPDNKITPIWRD